MGKHIIGMVIFFMLGLCSLGFSEEEITITTYYPSPYGSYNELTTASNTYLATSSGNVGIGTTGPNTKLQVEGSVFIPSGQSYWIGNYADSGDRLRMHQTGTHSYIDYATGNLNIRAGTTTKVLIDSAGNVGIGTASPSEKLHVAGRVKIVDGNQGAGKVLTSDANGVGTWQQALGISSCTIVTCWYASDGSCTATCPSGSYVTGGGFGGRPYASRPSGNGWYCQGCGDFGDDNCYAVCCR